MKRRLRQTVTNQASITSLRWTGLALVIMQAIYLTVTFTTDYFNELNNYYTQPTLIAILTGMLVLMILNAVKLIISPRNKTLVACAMINYYLSMVLFSFSVPSSYRDGILAILWVILLSTTGILFGRRLFIFGTVAMFVTTISNPIILNYDFKHTASLGFVIVMVIYASYQFYRYREIGLIELRGYNQLKHREQLQTRRFKAVVNNLRDALISVSPKGLIQLYNAASLNLLDTNQNIMGMNINKVMPLVDEDGETVLLTDIIQDLKSSTERTDLRLVYGDGQYANIRLAIAPVRNQQFVKVNKDIDGAIIMVADITQEKSLDDERDEFIGVVSHELRTPVAIAEGALSNLQLLIERGDNPELLAKTLDSAHKQILYLGQMVNDLSTLSRAQRGVYMDNEEIDINEFFTSLYHKYVPQAKEQHLRLIADIDVEGIVLVPMMVIEEIMQNLITNAIKYTERGSVTIGVKRIDDDKEHVRFYVKDTGIGISKAEIGHLFERFWRSEDYRTHHIKGTGLGLHVVDQLAKKIDVNIDVVSKVNVGSTFSLVLPYHPKDK